MSKAKSRLNKSQAKSEKQEKLSLFRKYRRHLGALFISLPFYGAVVFHLNYVYPIQIKNFLIPNAYLPLQFYLFVGNFFFFSFLLVHSRRGLVLSLWLSSLIFFKLQNLLSLPLLLVTTLPFLIFESVSSFLDRE